MASELWLIRHGETEWSVAGRHTGTTDLPLTDTGRQAAVRLGQRLAAVGFDRVLVSPLLRARQTCELAGFLARAETADELHEWRYGDDEGRTTAEIRAERPGWTVWKDGPKGGEPVEAVGARADRFLAAMDRAEGRIACFAHAHLLRVLAARWLGWPARDGARLRLDTASISVVGTERETRVIRLWNDSGRLPA